MLYVVSMDSTLTKMYEWIMKRLGMTLLLS